MTTITAMETYLGQQYRLLYLYNELSYLHVSDANNLV